MATSKINWWQRGIISFFTLIFFVGCYGPEKAQKQFGRAAATYPAIPAEYCAITYPAKDSLIKGKDSIRVDTLWGDGETIIDTVRTMDTIRITKIIQLPGTVITKTVVRTDTAYIENTAKLALCDMERRQALADLRNKTIESDGWEKKARKRYWIMWGLFALIIIFTGYKIYSAFKPKK